MYPKIESALFERLSRERGLSLSVELLEETGSTNSDAAKRLRECPESAPFVIFANRQSAGRGRLGRQWASQDCGNICASFAFAPKIAPEKMANFTPWMGVALAKALREHYSAPIKVKWPNDLFCDGKKLAGMLTEAHLDSTQVHGVIFGIGLNVTHVPAGVENIAVSLADLIDENSQGTLNLTEVAVTLAQTFERAADAFFTGKYAEEFSQLWACYDSLYGKEVTAIYGNETFTGTALGIDSSGRLLIQIKDGALHAFSAGDVTLKK